MRSRSPRSSTRSTLLSPESVDQRRESGGSGERAKIVLVNVIYIRTTPRALWNALTQPQFTRQYYVGLELRAELRRGGRFDYMHRAELHGRPGAGVEGVVIEVLPRRKLVHSFEPKFIEDRSEEHTSELQSLTNLVCRLLLEKKKKTFNERLWICLQ